MPGIFNNTHSKVQLSENDNPNMTSDELKIERLSGVFVLKLNRPKARNALNIALTRQLKDQLLEFETDKEMQVLVVTGEDPAFCAGLDLKDFSAPDSPRSEVGAMIDMWAALTKPVIAAVNGPAMTGGLEIALGCDFIIASENARFGDTHLKIGAMAGGGMTARLPNAVGLRWAKQMSLTGTPIDAATALRIGLVNEVIAHDQLMPYVLSVATSIAAHNTELLHAFKNVINEGSLTTLRDALSLEKQALAAHRARGATQWKR